MQWTSTDSFDSHAKDSFKDGTSLKSDRVQRLSAKLLIPLAKKVLIMRLHSAGLHHTEIMPIRRENSALGNLIIPIGSQHRCFSGLPSRHASRSTLCSDEANTHPKRAILLRDNINVALHRTSITLTRY